MFSSFHIHRTVDGHLVQGRARDQDNEAETLHAVDHESWLVPAKVFQSFVQSVGRDPFGVRFAQASRSGVVGLCDGWQSLAKLIEQRFTSAMPADLETVDDLLLLFVLAHGVLP